LFGFETIIFYNIRLCIIINRSDRRSYNVLKCNLSILVLLVRIFVWWFKRLWRYRDTICTPQITIITKCFQICFLKKRIHLVCILLLVIITWTLIYLYYFTFCYLNRSLSSEETYLVVMNVGSEDERVNLMSSWPAAAKDETWVVHTPSVNSQFSIG